MIIKAGITLSTRCLFVCVCRTRLSRWRHTGWDSGQVEQHRQNTCSAPPARLHGDGLRRRLHTEKTHRETVSKRDETGRWSHTLVWVPLYCTVHSHTFRHIMWQNCAEVVWYFKASVFGGFPASVLWSWATFGSDWCLQPDETGLAQLDFKDFLSFLSADPLSLCQVGGDCQWIHTFRFCTDV